MAKGAAYETSYCRRGLFGGRAYTPKEAHKKHKVFWNNVALHLTRQEYNFLYLLAVTPMRVYTFEQIYQLVWKDYSVGDIKNIIWCLVKRLRKKLNVVEDGAGNCIVSVRDIGYKFELNNENEQQ